MKVLSIESSCDETSAAVVVDSRDPQERILSNIINSQIQLHAKYGGVIPEYAARNHLDSIDKAINDALEKAGVSLDDIDVVAATSGPGLIGGLLVGAVTAKTIALFANKPFMAINHLEAHLLTARLCYNTEFPYLLLLASGGHFIFVEVFGVGKYKILGETLDDAAGEAFDKVAKMLGFSYPGGPSIEKAAISGDKNRFDFTVPLQRKAGCDVSFSGIKTATKIHIQNLGDAITLQDKNDIAASFQNIVVTFIIKQLQKAYNLASSNIKNIVVAGGVAANSSLRENIHNFCDERSLNFYAPPLSLCSDNAAMIGWTAIERINAGFGFSGFQSKTKPRWPITEI